MPKKDAIGIFVGLHDYPSQNWLANKRKRQGWTRGEMDTSRNIKRALRHALGKIVMINGADAGACVPKVISNALDRGASRVVVPLDQVQTYIEDKNSRMTTRARVLALVLDSMGIIDDTRVLVTPTRIWTKAVRRAKRTPRNS